MFLFFNHVNSLSDIVLQIVEGAHKDEDHLLVKLWDVVPDKEDDGAELTSDRNCVLSIVLLVFVGACLTNEVVVDDSGLDLGAKLDEELAVSEFCILEIFNLLDLTDPVKEVLLSLSSDDLQVV